MAAGTIANVGAPTVVSSTKPSDDKEMKPGDASQGGTKTTEAVSGPSSMQGSPADVVSVAKPKEDLVSKIAFNAA